MDMPFEKAYDECFAAMTNAAQSVGVVFEPYR